jgi:hypothetical protein
MRHTHPIQSIPSTPIYLVYASKSLAHPPALSLAIPRGARGASGTLREQEEDEDGATRSGRRGRAAGLHGRCTQQASISCRCPAHPRMARALGKGGDGAKMGEQREGQRERGEDGGDAWCAAVLASVRARGRETMGRWEGEKESGGNHRLEGEVEGL